jgi:hypothetical protein
MINILTSMTIIPASDGGKSAAKILKVAQKREKMKLVATFAAAC